MSQRKPDIKTLLSTLERDGYALASKIPTKKGFVDFGKMLGFIKATRFGDVSTVRALHPTQSRRGTFSAKFGKGAQPFHTDAAFLGRPPRFVLLRLVGGDERTPTYVMDVQRLLVTEQQNLENSRWTVFGRPIPFAAGGVGESAGRRVIRFDPFCMKPRNREAQRCIPGLSFGRIQNRASKITLKHHDVLVLDNWRVLHARGAVEINSDRTIERILIERRA